MGGLVCSACHPPRTDADCVQKLVICGGMWDDADNPFDFQGGEPGEFGHRQEARGQRAATSPAPQNPNATAAQQSATNIDEATTSEPLTTPRNSRRVGEPLLDLELDFYFGLPTGDLPQVVSARMIGEVSQTERKRTGLLESRALDRGFVGGTVRRGEGAGPGVSPPQVPTVKPQFAVGQVVRLLRRLSTFRGVVSAGDGYVVSSAGVDSHGETVVALSRGGVVLVSGLVSDPETLAACEQIPIDDLLG